MQQQQVQQFSDIQQLKKTLQERQENLSNSYNQLGTQIDDYEKEIERLRESRNQLRGVIEYNKSIINTIADPQPEMKAVPKEESEQDGE